MNKDNKNIFKYILMMLIIIVLIYIILKYGLHLNERDLRRHIFRDLRIYILSYGKFAAIMYIIVYSLKPVVLIIPVSLMSILAGNIFGPHKAIILSMIGCFTSATLAFFLARLLGRSFVDKILKRKAMNLDSNIEKHGFKIMLVMRLCFIFPYDPLSYAAGLTKMKYKDFILGSLIGVFPEMIAYSFMGKNIEHPFSIKFVLPIILIVIFAVSAMSIYKPSKNINK
ncbi:TVP38/TMEM64 family protein [Clostridium sp. DJ247]|uniref:TVP38/TMEM64 family protein n=1 Tax=Clostridium sp. DJ247 TaxID=2726188 RepID=UPI0016270045|nr:TVP38/TMEM64 family protein [Clostridium sp. DJ247]MBC2581528.1 TVP38/TMEM64 family protein [Clostridium sp. DJ247]